jgi:putative GTP pyrophosphokinase
MINIRGDNFMAELEQNTDGGELSLVGEVELIKNSQIFINQTLQFQELMMMYDCAIREVKTKLEVLNAELSVRYKRNPIEFISSRIKKPASIAKKLQKKGKQVSVSAIEATLSDVGGIRVICSFVDDIYEIASMLVRQDDIILVEQKDYINEPKENGYRSLHLIIEIPVFFSDQKKMMRVEVQIRTIAMDFWASLEHQLRYKHVINNEEEINRELKECAEVIAATDIKMLRIRNKIQENTNEDDFLEKMNKIDLSSYL